MHEIGAEVEKARRVQWIEDALARKYERDGRLAPGTLSQGFVSHVQHAGEFVTWTPDGGAVVCENDVLADHIMSMISERGTGDHSSLFSALKSEVARTIPDAHCRYYVLLYQVPRTGRRVICDRPISPLSVQDIWTNPDVDPPEFDSILGIKDGDTVVAYASSRPMFDVYGPSFYSVGVRTHEEYRRRGYGRAVVQAVLEHVAVRNGVAVWECIAENVASHRLALSCGFVDYARTFQWMKQG